VSVWTCDAVTRGASSEGVCGPVQYGPSGSPVIASYLQNLSFASRRNVFLVLSESCLAFQSFQPPVPTYRAQQLIAFNPFAKAYSQKGYWAASASSIWMRPAFRVAGKNTVAYMYLSTASPLSHFQRLVPQRCDSSDRGLRLVVHGSLGPVFQDGRCPTTPCAMPHQSRDSPSADFVN